MAGGEMQNFKVNADLFEKYYKKLIEVHANDNEILRGRVIRLADEEDGLCVVLEDVERNGRKLPYNLLLGESDASHFIPLEGENPEGTVFARI
jgi:hypothetical protein